jgi:hypothetical protein
MRSFLRIVFEALTAILAVIALWSWFAPNTARLRVLVKTGEVQIPSAYREYLHATDASYPDPNRKALIWIHDTAAAALKQQNSPPLLGLERHLEAMRAFAESAPVFRFTDPQAVTVKIVNVGGKVAKNVKVSFSDEGFVEITKDGTLVNAARHKGWIDLGALEPSSQFVVVLWTGRGSLGGVHVISDEGTANVREWYVSRDENRWVIGFGQTEIVFFSFIALCVFILLLSLISTDLRAEKAAKTQEGNEGTPD